MYNRVGRQNEVVNNMCRITKNLEWRAIWNNIKSWGISAWNRGKSWFSTTRIIPAALYPIILVGVAVYFIKYFLFLHGGEQVDSPLTLAAIAVALGGFILLGAFYIERPRGQKVLNRRLVSADELKRIAKFFLGSAISFVISFLMLGTLAVMPTSPPSSGSFTQAVETACLTVGEWLVVIVSAVAIGAAMYTFSIALVSLLNIIRKM
jgi:hypothetical protein